jgi:hypothetical protein
VPPGFRWIVPSTPRASVPPTITRPPDMVSMPVPLDPTTSTPLLLQVPPVTIAVPMLPGS